MPRLLARESLSVSEVLTVREVLVVGGPQTPRAVGDGVKTGQNNTSHARYPMVARKGKVFCWRVLEACGQEGFQQI